MRLIPIIINFCGCKSGAMSLGTASLPWERSEVSVLQDHINAKGQRSPRKGGRGGEHGISVSNLATHHSTNAEEELPAGNTMCPFFTCEYLMERVNSSWLSEILFPCAAWLGLSAAVVHGYVLNSPKPKEKVSLLPPNCESIW